MAKKDTRGRPKVPINKDQLEQLMGYRPSLFDVSGFFKCSRETIIRFITKEYGMTYKEFRSTYMSGMKLSLIQKAIAKARGTDGNPRGDNDMLKFCLINLAGWVNGNAQKNEFDDEDFVEEIDWISE